MTYVIKYKATSRATEALCEALGVPHKDTEDFYIPNKLRYAKSRREYAEFLLDLVNNGLAEDETPIIKATYVDGFPIFEKKDK